jgi:serine/threonine protein kinase
MSQNLRLISLGNYHLQKVQLGQGSFARVELARHILINTPVALKIISTNAIKDPYVYHNLNREAAILSKLNHPNIVRLIEICVSTDIYCLVLEYEPGAKNLGDVIGQYGALGEFFSRPIARHIISALLYMHSKKILHRDLKLDNVMVNEDFSRCFLIDFGLSNFWYAGKNMKTHCGSVEFAAPELFRRELNYGPAIDIWSFGVILFGMLFGKLPFVLESGDQKNMLQLITLISNGPSMAHFEEMDNLSAYCRSLILKCLEINHEARISGEGWGLFKFHANQAQVPHSQCSLKKNPKFLQNFTS